jgi:hypothetical protein
MLALTAIGLRAVEVVTHWKDIGNVIKSVFDAIGSAVDAIGGAISQVGQAFVWVGKEAIKLWSSTPLGGIIGFLGNLLGGNLAGAATSLAKGFTFGQVNLTPASLGAGPSVQPSQSSNTSVPATQHRAGDHTTTIHNVINLDGRTIAENVVHHVQKGAAMYERRVAPRHHRGDEGCGSADPR